MKGCISNSVTGETERTNRISRFGVERQGARRCDPLSEHVIIEWRSAGHDGGGIVFGHDGMLYISTGDGTSDSDGWDTGQDLSDFMGGVLRIDVDHAAGTQAYSVPKDNPFVGRTNARPEIWDYGLRNPWRLTIDRQRGHIWAGNNGQDLWETAHLVRRGENYRWDESQSDATLVGAKGGEKEFVIKDKGLPGGIRRQVWRYPSRAECMSCHSRGGIPP